MKSRRVTNQDRPEQWIAFIVHGTEVTEVHSNGAIFNGRDDRGGRDAELTLLTLLCEDAKDNNLHSQHPQRGGVRFEPAPVEQTQLHIFTYQEQDWQEKPLTITVAAKSKDLAVQQLGLGGYDPADYDHQALDLREGAYIATYAMEPFLETNQD